MYKNIQEIWLTMKRQKNLQVIGIEEQEETQAKTTENVLNKIIEDNFSSRNKKVQESYRTANRMYQKRNFPQYIIIKTLNRQNKETV